MQPLKCTICLVRAKCVIVGGAQALAHIILDSTGEEIGTSIPCTGMGGDSVWYDFQFGHLDEEQSLVEDPIWIPGTVRIYISLTPPTNPLETNKLVYFLDNKPLRKLNHFMMVSPASFDSRHEVSPSGRNIPMEIVFNTKKGLDLNKDPQEIAAEQRKKEKEALFSLVDTDEVEEQEARLLNLAIEKQSLLWLEPKEAEKGRMYARPPPDRNYQRLQEIEHEELATLERLRRQLLKQADTSFEHGLEHMPNRELSLHVACSAGAAYNPRMSEYWVLSSARGKGGTLFRCCDMFGVLRREVVVAVTDVKCFTFDGSGDLFCNNSSNYAFRYRPTHPEKSDFFARSWVAEVPDQQYASGVATDDDKEVLFVLFMTGNIAQLKKSSGILQRVIVPRVPRANACGLIFALRRFLIADAHAIKVVDMRGETISVLMGGFKSSDEDEKVKKVHLLPQSFVSSGLDNPLMMWDGSFLWLTDAQYRKIDDHNLPVERFSWSCFAPLSIAHSSVYGYRKLPAPEKEWAERAKVKAEALLNKKFANRRPSVSSEPEEGGGDPERKMSVTSNASQNSRASQRSRGSKA